MAKIYSSMEELVGHTPLLEIKRTEEKLNLKAKILCKLEYFNPAGSVKDRVALEMILNAEKEGKITKGSTLIEPTSGNTGIGLSAVGKARGYNVIVVMPDSMSRERILAMKAYGAEVILTEGKLGMNGAINKAEELCKEILGSMVMGQFTNPSNPLAHIKTTGPEIWEDTNGLVDIFISGVGTGGTISGVGNYLKKQNKNIEIIAVEPEDSPVLSEGKSGPHKLQGIGAGFIPKTLDTSIYNRIERVTTDEAYNASRDFGKIEGILVGISSGAALSVAIKEAQKEENKGKSIVVILPDGGDRYFSTPLFE